MHVSQRKYKCSLINIYSYQLPTSFYCRYSISALSDPCHIWHLIPCSVYLIAFEVLERDDLCLLIYLINKMPISDRKWTPTLVLHATCFEWLPMRIHHNTSCVQVVCWMYTTPQKQCLQIQTVNFIYLTPEDLASVSVCLWTAWCFMYYLLYSYDWLVHTAAEVTVVATGRIGHLDEYRHHPKRLLEFV